MAHASVNAFRHVGVHLAEHFGGFVDAPFGHMSVHIAAPEKNPGPFERPCRRLPRRPWWTDQAAAEHHDTSERLCMPIGKFRSKTGALGKSQKHDALCWNAA